MLKYMRTHATSWIIKVGLSFIIVVFALYFGFGRMRGKQEGMVAEVNGQYVSRKDFNEAYQNLMAMYRNRFKGGLSEEMMRGLGLKQQALDGLINSILLYQEALRMNLRVSPEELKNHIQSIPAFQVNGKFHMERYRRILRANRIKSEDFEQEHEQHLLIDKLRNLILQHAGVVSEEEAREAYQLENEKVNLEFIKIGPASFLEKSQATRVSMISLFKSG
jgi:peptidyl-prolyl cis-trans isomerase D